MLNRAQPPGFGVGRSELYRGDSSLSRRECLQSGGAFCSCQSPDAVDASGEAKKVDHGPMFVGYALLQSLIWLRITLAPLLCVPKRSGGTGDEVRQEWDVIAACQSFERADARARTCRPSREHPSAATSNPATVANGASLALRSILR